MRDMRREKLESAWLDANGTGMATAGIALLDRRGAASRGPVTGSARDEDAFDDEPPDVDVEDDLDEDDLDLDEEDDLDDDLDDEDDDDEEDDDLDDDEDDLDDDEDDLDLDDELDDPVDPEEE